jgi:GH15 family glucan-1,4-alpha-glucosidase
MEGYAPIEAYAAVGDGRIVALVAADGSVDWLALPALDSPPVFGALLDARRGGCFALEPEVDYEVERRYVERSNVLETTFRTSAGDVRVTDAATLQDGAPLPWIEFARRIEGVSGSVPMRWRIRPGFDFGRRTATVARRGSAIVASETDLRLVVHAWDAGEPRFSSDEIGARFETTRKSRSLIALTSAQAEPLAFPTKDEVDARVDATWAAWQRWADRCVYGGPWADAVLRSALALKLLISAPAGSIAAAATTSLPEQIGGDRNYDYRYAWVRDSSFTLDALIRLGFREQAHASFASLLRAANRTHPRLRPFYSLGGEVPAGVEELDLEGYRGSRPVRRGNGATEQLQLGCYGDLLETAELYVREGNRFDDETGILLAETADFLCEIWRRPDSGIWELEDQQQYTVSKMSCWAAFDRALQLADQGEIPAEHAERWRREAESVRTFVETDCWSDDLQSYVFYAGTDRLDAACLRASRMGYGDPAGERMAGTIAAVREKLGAGGALLYRYTGQRGREGAFLACSFWLVEALARAGRLAEARATMDELVGLANDVGLFSEELDPQTHEFLGNFPQGLTHLALVNAASTVEQAEHGTTDE